MAEYRLTDTDVVIRTDDGAYIPNDPANADRVAYEEWLAAGGVPDPAQTAAPTDVVAESAKSLALAQAKRLNAAGQTGDALDILIRHIEGAQT